MEEGIVSNRQKGKQRSGMTGKRWRELKDRASAAPRYTHISCIARMVPDPSGPNLPAIPYIAPGHTYNVGRNAAKRARRALVRAA
jgi:hypothetical protein